MGAELENKRNENPIPIIDAARNLRIDQKIKRLPMPNSKPRYEAHLTKSNPIFTNTEQKRIHKKLLYPSTGFSLGLKVIPFPLARYSANR
jgi:hypothetical protein